MTRVEGDASVAALAQGSRGGRWRAVRIAALVALTIAIALALRAVDWSRTGDAIRQANVAWLVAAVLANASILLWWAAFWRSLRPRAEPASTYGRMLEIVSASSALMNTLPFGGGHASSVVLMIRRATMSQRGALSVLALDQLGEGIVKIGVFLLVGLIVPLPEWMRVGVTTASLVVGVWFVTLMIASTRTAELEALRSWRRAGVSLACVIGMRGAQLLAMIAVQQAYGVTLPAGGSLLALAAVLFAFMLPIAPGNLGTYEAGVFLAYRYLGVSPEQALSLAIMQHVCFLLPAIGVGYVVFSAQTLSRSAIASR